MMNPIYLIGTIFEDDFLRFLYFENLKSSLFKLAKILFWIMIGIAVAKKQGKKGRFGIILCPCHISDLLFEPRILLVQLLKQVMYYFHTSWN